MTAVRLPVKQGSAEWLEARRSKVGSSEIPMIIGESSYKSAYTLGAEKLGLIPEIIDAETRELMDIGILMQPVLIAIHRLKTGLPTREAHGWLQHPQIPWATASLDARAGRRAVEAKWSNALKWRVGEAVPGDVKAQVQWQLFVTGWDVADVVVMAHGQPRIETVERSDRFIDDLLYFATEFHERLERGELPPIDGSESTAATLRARHPRDDGTWLEATPELAALAADLAASRSAKRAAEDQEKSIASALRAVIGDASGITGVVSLKNNRDSTRVNWPGVAVAYRQLLEEFMPLNEREQITTLESIHTVTAEGARVLRLLTKGHTDD